jgi:hypothetical protein
MVRTNLGPIRPDANAAWDLMSHDIAIANYWLGAEPEVASAVGGIWINPGVEDAVFATLRYPGGILLNVHASWLNPRKARDISVAGDKAMLTFDDMNLLEPVRFYDKQVAEKAVKAELVDTFALFRASIREGDVTIPKISSGEPLKAECDHFIECVRNGTQPLVGGREAGAVVRALEAIDRSIAQHGRDIAPTQPRQRDFQHQDQGGECGPAKIQQRDGREGLAKIDLPRQIPETRSGHEQLGGKNREFLGSAPVRRARGVKMSGHAAHPT